MPPPPPLARKPGRVEVFRALYNYTAVKDDEISFEEGDMIYVSAKGDDGWWKATVNGKAGLIPGNYVEADGGESIAFPLHEAAKRGNLPFLKECLTNKVSVNGLDKAGSTPLHWAARGGHLDCLHELLKVPNVQVNVPNKLGDTALHGAAWKGQTEAVNMLLQASADVHARNNEKLTPYDLGKAHPATARLLIPRGAAPICMSINDRNDRQARCLWYNEDDVIQPQSRELFYIFPALASTLSVLLLKFVAALKTQRQHTSYDFARTMLPESERADICKRLWRLCRTSLCAVLFSQFSPNVFDHHA
eukprot:m.234193 g.234193  ORF g.234193 m.234193 type:complete len:305 (+) comp19312_c0_seq22:66-980(+)